MRAKDAAVSATALRVSMSLDGTIAGRNRVGAAIEGDPDAPPGRPHRGNTDGRRSGAPGLAWR